MLASAKHQNPFVKSVATFVLLLVLLLTMAFAFAKVSVPTHVAPHAQNSHAEKLACGGINAPECGAPVPLM